MTKKHKYETFYKNYTNLNIYFLIQTKSYNSISIILK